MDEWLLWRRVALGICCSVSIKLRSPDARLIQYSIESQGSVVRILMSTQTTDKRCFLVMERKPKKFRMSSVSGSKNLELP